MKTHKVIKRTVYKSVPVEVEDKIPVWYYRFLLWLFGHEEAKLDSLIFSEYRCAWDKGFDVATKKAHTYKEAIMERKLNELGYQVQPNYPMARLSPEKHTTNDCFEPSKSWDIVKINND